MTSAVYTYICVRQTLDVEVPSRASNLTLFARDVSDAFYATQGGYRTVGQLALFPAQKSIADHLLCDGKEVPKESFPELYDYLGDFEGTPVDPDNFVLPNYIGTLAAAATAAPETVESGTVTSETPSDPGTGVGGSEDYAVDSGARVRQGAPP